MSEIKISANGSNNTGKVMDMNNMPASSREQLDICDVKSFQSLLSEKVESDKKRAPRQDAGEEYSGSEVAESTFGLLGAERGTFAGEIMSKFLVDAIAEEMKSQNLLNGFDTATKSRSGNLPRQDKGSALTSNVDLGGVTRRNSEELMTQKRSEDIGAKKIAEELIVEKLGKREIASNETVDLGGITRRHSEELMTQKRSEDIGVEKIAEELIVEKLGKREIASNETVNLAKSDRKDPEGLLGITQKSPEDGDIGAKKIAEELIVEKLGKREIASNETVNLAKSDRKDPEGLFGITQKSPEDGDIGAKKIAEELIVEKLGKREIASNEIVNLAKSDRKDSEGLLGITQKIPEDGDIGAKKIAEELIVEKLGKREIAADETVDLGGVTRKHSEELIAQKRSEDTGMEKVVEGAIRSQLAKNEKSGDGVNRKLDREFHGGDGQIIGDRSDVSIVSQNSEQIVGDQVLNALARVSDSEVVASAEPIVKIGNEIIERLMVVQAIRGAKQEVVIVFRENVLPGTQVSFLREGSALSLNFSSTNLQSLEILTANHGGLRNFLLDQLKDITAVDIRMEQKNGSFYSARDGHQKRRQQDETAES